MFLILIVLLLVLAFASTRYYPKLAFGCGGLALVVLMAIGSGWLPALLLQALQSDYRQAPVIDWKKPTFIAVLAGGAVAVPEIGQVWPSILSYGRIMMATKLYNTCQANGGHCTIIGSGKVKRLAAKSMGESYGAEWLALGVPQAAIEWVPQSDNTYQEAEYIASKLALQPKRQVLLVSSGYHLRRAVKIFAHFGVRVIPIAADYVQPTRSYVPLSYNFTMMDIAAHEYLGEIGVSWVPSCWYRWAGQLC